MKGDASLKKNANHSHNHCKISNFAIWKIRLSKSVVNEDNNPSDRDKNGK